MSGFDSRAVTRTYSAVAEDYARTYADHLDRVEVDREMLDATARRATGDGPVVDLGCGPAHVGGYLAEWGCDVVGVDAALGMLAVARRRNPGLSLLAGDMRGLPLRSGSCAGLVAFYLLHHVPRAELRLVLRELRRVLLAGGPLLVATHAGAGEFRSRSGLDGQEITGTLYADDELVRALAAEQFAVDAVRHRDRCPTSAKRTGSTWRRPPHGDRCRLLERRGKQVVGGECPWWSKKAQRADVFEPVSEGRSPTERAAAENAGHPKQALLGEIRDRLLGSQRPVEGDSTVAARDGT